LVGWGVKCEKREGTAGEATFRPERTITAGQQKDRLEEPNFKRRKKNEVGNVGGASSGGKIKNWQIVRPALKVDLRNI